MNSVQNDLESQILLILGSQETYFWPEAPVLYTLSPSLYLFFFFLAVLGFELRALRLVGRCSMA
jgi:hypothetical protein